MELWHWLLGETGCIAISSLGLGGGLTVALAPTKINKRLAHYLFALGFSWVVACSVKGLVHAETTMRYVYVFLIGGTISALWLGSWRWVEANYTEAVHEQGAPSATPKPSQEQNSPGNHNNQQQQNNSGGINTQQSTTGANSPIINGSNVRITTHVYSGPKPNASGFHEAAPEDATFKLGTSGIGYTVSLKDLRNPKFHFDFIRIKGSDFVPMRLYLENGVVLCDVKLWNGIGKPLVEITGNQFKVTPEGWDKNFTDDAIEVVDSRHIPVFQLIRTGPATYVATGYFIVPGGVLIATDGVEQVFDKPVHIEPILTPIFKYPSWKYRGKYADGSN